MSKAESPTAAASEAASPSDSVIAGDFGALSAEEQEKQREEWKTELAKTEEEIMTLKQVLASKEAHAAGLKRRLGITAWREFSEDMAQGLKSVQDSAAYKMTAEGINVAKEKTLGWMGAVTASSSFQNMSGKMNNAFGAAKSKVSAAMNTEEGAAPAEGAKEAKEAAPAAANGSEAKKE